MTSQTRATLKGYFNTNDQPTEAEFADLIDSAVNVTDDPARLLATGATTGATAQAQTFTNGILAPTLNGVGVRLTHNVVCLGDSITSNVYPDALQVLLGTGWHVVNQGIGGNTTAQMLARFEVCVTNDTEHVVILGGINDVFLGADAATIETNLADMYYLAHHNAGMVVIAATITPFKNHASWDAGKQAVVDAVNAWIMAGPLNADYSVNAFSVLEDGGTPDALAAAYDSGDGVHPNSAGFAALATAVYGQLTWVPSSATHGMAINGTDVYLNQSLATSDSVIFDTASLADNLNLLNTSIDGEGIRVGGSLFLHNFRNNLFLGPNAGNLTMSATAENNLGIGSAALAALTSGQLNLAIGAYAGDAITSGSLNLAIGFQALTSNATGSNNVALGASVLALNTSGVQNVGVGNAALAANTIGINNTAIGYGAAQKTWAGHDNTALGYLAANSGNGEYFNNNLAIGSSALFSNQSGNGNVALGCNAGYYETGSAKLFIDNAARESENDAYEKALIYGIFAATVANQELRFNAGKIGFGVSPIATQVLATGIGATADNIITALQNLGLVKQS